MDSERKLKHSSNLEASSSEGSSDSEADSQDSEEGQEVNVNFEACNIMQSDREGIKLLMRQIFLKEPDIDINAITDILVNQKDNGFIIRQYSDETDSDDEYEEDEVLGIISYLNISDNIDKECIKNFCDYLTKHLQKAERHKMEEIILSESKKVWLINERFVNLPWKLALPSFEQTCKEILAGGVDYDQYIMICKIMYPRLRGGHRRKQVRENIVFLNPEEEIFDECCVHRFEFNVSSQCDSDPRGGDWDEEDMQYVPHRRILVFDKSSWNKAIKKLKEASK